MSGLLPIARWLCFGLAFLTAIAYIAANRMHTAFPLTGFQTALVIMPLLALGNVAHHRLQKESKPD